MSTLKSTRDQEIWLACFTAALTGVLAQREIKRLGVPMGALGQTLVKEAGLLADLSMEEYAERTKRKGGGAMPVLA